MRLIVRPPSEAFSRALSEHPDAAAIDVGRAVVQHGVFVAALRAAGVEVVELAPDPDCADACFVSDVLFTLPRADDPVGPAALLVAGRPGAESRRPEVAAVAARGRELAEQARALEIVAPGEIDFGDVIVYGDRVAIGVSARTNQEGARQLAAAVAAAGYRAFLCPVSDRLHLATAITVLRSDRLIGTAAGFASLDDAGPEVAPAGEVERLLLPDNELVGANVLAVGGRCFVPAGNPVAVALMRAAGETVVELDLSQFTLADGGPTCLVTHVW
jgi:dimethylargininase